MKSVKVKARRVRGRTKISAKNQDTIRVEALKRAGLKSGGVNCGSKRQIRAGSFSSERPMWFRHAGRFTGVYPSGYLAGLRSEWR
jgi:hypothetical protein